MSVFPYTVIYRVNDDDIKFWSSSMTANILVLVGSARSNFTQAKAQPQRSSEPTTAALFECFSVHEFWPEYAAWSALAAQTTAIVQLAKGLLPGKVHETYPAVNRTCAKKRAGRLP